MNNKYACYFAVCLLLFFPLIKLPAQATQHPLIEKLIIQSRTCQPNYYFSSEQIESKLRHLTYLDKIAELLETKNADQWYLQSERLNLIPVNKCVVRGNKEFFKPENQDLLKALKVNNLVNMDFVAHNIVKGKTYGFKYTFAPINPAAYPKRESAIAIMNVLNILSFASPDGRIYISCFYGKHRSSLLSAIYQFIGEYAINPKQACERANTERDQGWNQGVAIANLGVLTYNMPTAYKRFYRNLTDSICKENSAEFLQKLEM